MVRNYKRKGNRAVGFKYSFESLNSAIDAVKSGQMTCSKAAEIFLVPRSTIQHRVRGWKNRQPLGKSPSGKQYAIPKDIEIKLVDNIRTMNRWGFGLTRKEMLDTVQQYVESNLLKTPFKNGQPGEDWFLNFSKRHKLSLKRAELLEASRAKQHRDPFIVYDFFDKLESIMRENNLLNKSNCIWNCNETGFNHDPKGIRVVAGVGEKQNMPSQEELVDCVQNEKRNPPLVDSSNQIRESSAKDLTNNEPSTSTVTTFEELLLQIIRTQKSGKPKQKKKRKREGGANRKKKRQQQERQKQKQQQQHEQKQQKQKQQKQKQQKQKCTESSESSETDDIEVTYAECDDSSYVPKELEEDMEKGEEEEESYEMSENEASEESEANKICPDVGQYIIVQLASKKIIKHFVAIVDHSENQEIRVKFFRRVGMSYDFIYPPQDDISVIEIKYILPSPCAIRRGSQAFMSLLEKNLCLPHLPRSKTQLPQNVG
ncbi:hypothetical protein NQ314_006130 [Rhamnusium bicolor]|uniref:HTH psq-type domain-containing protein n=1 Tax=Rhamnusium bicolor TaxID=1586634 RepID=A0AAV8Z7L8_9CUCU|nr:hypothetical protein NQ314_006130 [Rhamnusium bicolor]